MSKALKKAFQEYAKATKELQEEEYRQYVKWLERRVTLAELALSTIADQEYRTEEEVRKYAEAALKVLVGI